MFDIISEQKGDTIMDIIVKENGLKVVFHVREDKRVELVDISPEKIDSKILTPLSEDNNPEGQTHQFLSVQIAGESTADLHGFKHITGSASQTFLYRDHSLTDTEFGKELILHLISPGKLEAFYHMEFYTDTPVVRTYATLRNVSGDKLGLEYVSSFYYQGILKNGSLPFFDKGELMIPYNSWCNEAQWQSVDIRRIGLNHMNSVGYNTPDHGNNRYYYGNVGSWSSCVHLPMGMLKDKETGEITFYEIDYSGSWQIELGSATGGGIYVALLGPNDESDFYKELAPGEEFTTVPAAFGTTIGDESAAAAALTKYRRAIRRPNSDDINCNVIFNDYMNCLEGDPTEEKELRIIDIAADLGCEFYCIDAGWYDAGFWWNRVGEWEESPERFPGGLKKVIDYGLSKGLKMGLWLEIEVMGIACPLADKLPDDWFVMNHGKRRIDNKRYLLDFRNPAVREHCTGIIDRLVDGYGISFIKMDYNSTIGIGSDLNTDSRGASMLDHYRGYYKWIADVYKKHPDLIIENCGSGAQRMDYGILTYHSLQSTSDQTDVINTSHIITNVTSAVTPEQAGVWVYPYEDDREHIIYNMVNGMLLRPYVSGLVWNMSEDNLAVLREGISTYKKIRADIPQMTPFFPLGFRNVEDEVLAFGIQSETHAYLAVFAPGADSAEIPLPFPVSGAEVIYPASTDCEFELGNASGTDTVSAADTDTISAAVLYVKFPAKKCARVFKLLK